MIKRVWSTEEFREKTNMEWEEIYDSFQILKAIIPDPSANWLVSEVQADIISVISHVFLFSLDVSTLFMTYGFNTWEQAWIERNMKCLICCDFPQVLGEWPRRMPLWGPSHLWRLWAVPRLSAQTKLELWPQTKCLSARWVTSARSCSAGLWMLWTWIYFIFCVVQQ